MEFAVLPPAERFAPMGQPFPLPTDGRPGSGRELLALAVPLILGNAFITLQLTIDRIMLAKADQDSIAAAFPAAMLFWLPFSLLQGVAGYVTVFVAQYTGAGRPERVGPAVWQGLYFGVAGGLVFLLVRPLAHAYVALGDHDPNIQRLEVDYLKVLAFCALPSLVTASVSGFFAGRGRPWSVMAINGFGTAVNVGLGYGLIRGAYGLPKWGIVGAGWAAVAAAAASATLALVLFWTPKMRREYGTLSGWRFDRPLFARLIAFGGPAGVQMAADVFTFTLFTLYVARIDVHAAAATSIAVTLNLALFLPTVGMGQAVGVLVGQRLGEGRPDLARLSANVGVRWALGYMLVMGCAFAFVPAPLVDLFAVSVDAAPAGLESWALTAAMVPLLLKFVAGYSLADAVSVVYAGALRGAGDTRFVTWAAFGLSIPLMVVPAFEVVESPPGSWLAGVAESVGGKVYLCWAAATLYIFVLAVMFWLRFRGGRWQSMRVIESAAPEAVAVG